MAWFNERGYETGAMTLLRVLGLAGVHPQENARAHYYGKLFAWPMLILAFWLIVQWFLTDHGFMSYHVGNVISWFVWLAFVAETAVLMRACDNGLRYLRENWMNLFIIGSAVPVIWGHTPMTAMLRALRLIIIPRLLTNWWRT